MSQALLTTTTNMDDGPIPMASRVTHKFYEPIMLSVALNQATEASAIPPPPEPPIDTGDEKQVFHAFVNKLAHICDSEKGGSTVTALMVLRRETKTDAPHYWFAANRQTLDNLQTTAAFVKRILRKVGEAPVDPDNQHVVRKSMLYDILRFNRHRVLLYLEKLRLQVAECLKRCNMDKIDESK